MRLSYLLLLSLLLSLNWSLSHAADTTDTRLVTDTTLTDTTLIRDPTLTIDPTIIGEIDTTPAEPTDPTEPTDTQCQLVSDLILRQLPIAVGDADAIQKMLAVQPDEWLGRLNVADLMELIRGRFDAAASLPDDSLIGKLRNETSVLSYNLHRGEARYINRAMMRVSNDGSVAVEARTGLATVQKLVTTFGISAAQADLNAAHSNVLRAGIVNPQVQEMPSERLAIDVERTYFIPRQINGMRVEGSRFVVGINNQGMISRFRVRWPALILADPMDDSRVVVSREQMHKQILSELMRNETDCEQPPDSMSMQLAYVPMPVGNGDESDQRLVQNEPVRFRPQLLVNYMPGSLEEGGIVMQFNLY